MVTMNEKIQPSPVSDDEIMQHLDHVIAECRQNPGSLIPLLQLTQKMYGYLPEKALKK